MVLLSCQRSAQKHKQARALADQIIQNLDQESVYQRFPKKYFTKSELAPILDGIAQNCDWPNRDGKFVDFATQANIGGAKQTYFIYEYHLSCDSLRFILAMNMEREKPELMGFNVEPLEKENPLIINPEKQLKNR